MGYPHFLCFLVLNDEPTEGPVYQGYKKLTEQTSPGWDWLIPYLDGLFGSGLTVLINQRSH